MSVDVQVRPKGLSYINIPMIKYSIATEKSKFGCLVIPVLEDGKTDALVKDLNEVHQGLFEAVQELKDFEGKKGQMTFLYTGDTEVPRVLLVGLGKKKSFNVRAWNKNLGKPTKTSRQS